MNQKNSIKNNLNNNKITLPKSTPILSKITQRIMGGLFTIMAGTVAINEGSSRTAYPDSAGVWTICYGETKGVKKGDTRTNAECETQLRQSLQEHAKALNGLPDSTPDAVLVGSLDMAYNVGVSGFSSSKVKQHLIRKDYTAAGSAVLDWRYISRYQSKSPGPGWVLKASGKWQFDCSQKLNDKPNKVCWGLWKRRLWQSKAIGNQFSTADAAYTELNKL